MQFLLRFVCCEEQSTDREFDGNNTTIQSEIEKKETAKP